MGNKPSTFNFTHDSEYEYGLPSNTLDSFCILTKESKIIDVNDNFCNLMKCQKEQILDKLIYNYPKNQKQLGVSSKIAIKQISDMLQNLKGNYQFTYELKRFNGEHFFSIVNLCCGQFKQETVFRAIIKEIENPLFQTNNNSSNQFSELRPQFIQQHIQQIQDHLWKSSIKGSKFEKEILYHLYSLSQKYKNSKNDLQNVLKIIKNTQNISNFDNYYQNHDNNRNLLLNQEHAFDVMNINNKKEQKKTRIIVSIGHIILQIGNEHFLITNKSKILIKLHPKYECILKMVWEDQKFIFAFLSVESKKLFIEKLKTLFKRSIETINKIIEDEEDEIEEDENEELVDNKNKSKNGDGDEDKNKNEDEILEIKKSKIDQDLTQKKITNTKIDENNNNNNNNENGNKLEKIENKNKNKTNNNNENENENENEKGTESESESENENEKNNNKSKAKSQMVQMNSNDNGKMNDQNQKKSNNKEKKQFNIYNPKTEYTNVWSVYVLKADENSLETGSVHLGKGEFLLKSISFCLQLNYQQKLIVTRNPMRKRNIKFQYEDQIYEATFSEDIFANEFMKYHGKNFKYYDKRKDSTREFSMRTQNMIDFLSDKLGDDDEDEEEKEDEDNYEDSNSMFMLDFLKMDQNWELIQQQQPLVMAEFRASIMDERVKSNKVIIIKVIGNTKLMFGELELEITKLKVKESSSKKSVVNINFPGQRKSVSIMFKDSEERRKFMNLYKMNSKALSKLKKEEKKKNKKKRRLNKKYSSNSSHSRDSSLKSKILHFRSRSIFDNESQNKSENFNIPKSQSSSNYSFSNKSVNRKSYSFSENSELSEKNNENRKIENNNNNDNDNFVNNNNNNNNNNKEKEKEKEKEKGKESESENENNYNSENKTINIFESINIQVFTSKFEWKKGIFNFYKNNHIELITPEKSYKSVEWCSFRLIDHPTKKKVSKFKINNKNVLIKFSSESERNIFTKKFETNYESKKTLFIILIFWSTYQGKEMKRKKCKINVINDKLVFILDNNKQLKVPIHNQTKLFLNPSRPQLVKIDFPNKDFFILNFQDNLELKRFVEIVKSIIDFY
ncbi:eukaryotic translation initiation factor 4 gamma [Anaeramoeba flamelloides]|uniref:Eukaryotic translation initiation factor 4 gamma n=1 Tax=Anaeramoeba flamelloides TaxID=1746091 RepID=A0AAV7Y730_9EUKA|nr:eukaryotic translation initiation factor 4 gamma [Anaeramoeba flamelloides]